MASELAVYKVASAGDLSPAVAGDVGRCAQWAIGTTLYAVKHKITKGGRIALLGFYRDNSGSTNHADPTDEHYPQRPLKTILATGINTVINGQRGVGNVLVLDTPMNGLEPLYAFVPIGLVPDPAIPLDYPAFGMTPLIPGSYGFLASMQAYAAHLGTLGIATSITAIDVSDGRGNVDSDVTAAQHAALVRDLTSSGALILGLGAGPAHVFTEIYTQMGLSSENIFTADNAPAALDIFRTVQRRVRKHLSLPSGS